MVKVTTSIKIDNEKRELAKRKGIVLTDLLDQALDMALGLELKQSTQLQKEKDDLLQDKEILLKEKEDFLKDHESKILQIDFKLKGIEEALQGAIIQDKKDIKEKDYQDLFKIVLEDGEIDRDPKVIGAINDFADKYEMSSTEYEELKKRLRQDLIDYDYF